VHETGNHFPALERMRDFRMELDGVETAFFVSHRRHRAGLATTDDLESGRQFGDLVAVAHPDFQQAMAVGIGPVLDLAEESGMAPCADFGKAELALARTLHLAAELLCHGLHAVANAEHGDAKLENHLRRLPVQRLIDRVRTARENDSVRLEIAYEFFRNIERVQFAIDLLLADTAGNQLGDLGAEIENEYLLVGHGEI
jgi:hypothetical protein